MKSKHIAISVPLVVLFSCLFGFGQEGTLTTDPPKGITVQEIIQKFAAKEKEFKEARDNYTFRQSVKVDTLQEDTGKVDGEYYQVTDVVFNKAGKREEHVVFAPQNTLERVTMSPTMAAASPSMNVIPSRARIMVDAPAPQPKSSIRFPAKLSGSRYASRSKYSARWT